MPISCAKRATRPIYLAHTTRREHDPRQYLRGPAEFFLGLGRVAEEELDLGGAEVLGVHENADLVGFGITPDLGDAALLALPFDGNPHVLERGLGKASGNTQKNRLT